MTDILKVAIHGAAGRMGHRLISIAHDDPNLEITAGIDYPGHPQTGVDLGILAGVGALGINLCDTLSLGRDMVDAVIDFSLPEGTMRILKICGEAGIPLVVATTGLDAEQESVLRKTSEKISICWAPSMSLAVNLAFKLAQSAAKSLKDHDADVEILERHHRYKVDAPSGTALKFGQIISEAMDITSARYGREGHVGARPHNEIGYHAIRVGDNPGEHTIIYGMLGETIELTVRCSSRDCYVNGAYAAARYLQGKKPGLYSMFDVLGLE